MADEVAGVFGVNGAIGVADGVPDEMDQAAGLDGATGVADECVSQELEEVVEVVRMLGVDGAIGEVDEARRLAFGTLSSASFIMARFKRFYRLSFAWR